MFESLARAVALTVGGVRFDLGDWVLREQLSDDDWFRAVEHGSEAVPAPKIWQRTFSGRGLPPAELKGAAYLAQTWQADSGEGRG